MKKIIVFLAGLFLFSFSQAQISGKQVDSLVQKSLKTFDVPGIAVAIIKDGKVILSKGYGVTSLNTNEKMNEHTRFGIASNSKAFTAAALGMLVDSGKIKWTTPVTDIIPEFKLYAPYVTENFMIADLLTHRSGLGLGAGDLMFWPGNPDFSKEDIIHNLRYLKQVSQFRTKYDYDNLLYMVAGEVVAKVSGMSWEDFIESHIMKPLGMEESAASYSRLKDKGNVIDPHVPVNGKVRVVARDINETLNAAGGIYSSVYDMSKWAIMQMNDGMFGEGLKQSLFSKKVHNEMWTIHTAIPTGENSDYKTNFAGYGLGWFLRDEMGHKVATHTGGLLGIVTQVTLIPDMKLGIIVFTNQQDGGAFVSITNSIKDAYYGIKGKDRIKEVFDKEQESRNYANKIVTNVWNEINSIKTKLSVDDLKKYTGTFKDPWFGNVIISLRNGTLFFQAEKSEDLKGPMSYFKGNTFVVKWEDRSLDADAFVNFSSDFQGNPNGIKMAAISPLTDFSFDFQDLNFTRIR